MNRAKVFFPCFFFLFLFSSCCYLPVKNLFVLLPDPDGQTGKIQVSNPAGSQLLAQPKQATEITKAGEAPSAPFMMEEKEIRDLFGPALEAQPLVLPVTITTPEDKLISAFSGPIQDSSQPLPVIRFLLYFKTGSTELTDDSQKLFPEIVKILKVRKATDVSIVGHTDRVGSREANFKTGLKRANFILEMLRPIGIDPQNVEVFSHGEDNPLVQTEDEVPEPKNRRVEIIIR